MPVYNRFFLQPTQPGGQIDPNVLVQTGPLLQVEVSIPSALEQLLAAQNQPIPSPKTGWALIDTGATRTCVAAKTISGLGVSPIGVMLSGTAGGPVQQQLYLARLRFPGEAIEIDFGSVLANGIGITSALGRAKLFMASATRSGMA